MERWCQKINVCYFSVIWFVSGTVCNKTGFANPAAPVAHVESILLIVGWAPCSMLGCAEKKLSMPPPPPLLPPQGVWAAITTMTLVRR